MEFGLAIGAVLLWVFVQIFQQSEVEGYAARGEKLPLWLTDDGLLPTWCKHVPDIRLEAFKPNIESAQTPKLKASQPNAAAKPKQSRILGRQIELLKRQQSQSKAQVSSDKTTLFDALLNHEDGWILRQLERPTLLIWGADGTGKTEWAITLNLLRMLLLDIEAMHFVSPHVNKTKGRLQGFVATGGSDDYQAIAHYLEDYYQELAIRDESYPYKCVVFDELSNYKDYIPEQSSGLISKSISKCRTSHVLTTFIAHSDRIDKLGGSGGSGDRQMIDESVVVLQVLPAHSQTGKSIFSGNAILKSNVRDSHGRIAEKPVTFPGWLSSKYLLESYPELKLLPGSSEVTPEVTGQVTPELHPVTPVNQGCNWRDLTINRELFLEVTGLTSEGWTPSEIIKKRLGFKGRNYARGRQFYERLINGQGEVA